MTNGIGQHVQHLIEDALRAMLQNGIPGSAINGQLIAGSGGPLPPGGNTGSGYTPGAHTHALAELDQDGATDGDVITWDDGAGEWIAAPPAGGVSSVGLAMPAGIFDVAGSPVTSTGTLTVTLDDQSANTVLAGPASGGAAAPAFRALVADDIPVAAGLIAFGSATSTLDTDAALSWDDTNKRLGIGTSAPDYRLHILGSAAPAEPEIVNQLAYAGSVGPTIALRKTRGTPGAPAASSSGDDLGVLRADTWVTGTTWLPDVASIAFQLESAPTATLAPTAIIFRTYPGGLSAGNPRMIIASDGEIKIANGLRVGSAAAAPLGVIRAAGASGLTSLFLESANTLGTFASLKNTSASGRDFLIGPTGSASGMGAGKFAIYDNTAGAGRVIIDANGDVGIGTTDPIARLDVTGGYIRALDDGTNNNPTSGKGLELVGTGSQGYLLSIDRTGGVFQPLHIAGTQIYLRGTLHTVGSTSAATRTLSIDNGSHAYISWNVAGVEKWVMGNETGGSGDRFIMFNPTTGSYPIIITRANNAITFAWTIATAAVLIGGNQVLAGRRTGWGTPTGTLTRTAFDSGTVTLAQLAQRVAALVNDLLIHGMIGA